MKFPLFTSLLLLILAFEDIQDVSCENILVLSFMSSKSHKATYEPLLMELADRGHMLTIVTPLKSSKPHKNIKEIIGKNTEENPFMKETNIFEMKEKKENIVNPFQMAIHLAEICKDYYQMKQVLDLRDDKFDLIFVSAAMSECGYGLVHHLQTPFILLSPISPQHLYASATGTPSPASFVPFLMTGFSDRMNFGERTKNLISQMGFDLVWNWAFISPMETIYREALGQDTPSANDIQKEVSLILSNSHLTLSYARPLMPDIIEVGGMACKPAKPLPKELDDFITGAGKDGVIYFSMGSVIQAKTMPESYRKMFINAFAKLKQKVLWKWETEEMEDLPKNVKLAKWLPQQDVLGHPNVFGFITHGGLGSIVEAVYHGVPLVGIPMFADQLGNMKQSSELGFAVTIEFSDLSEETILESINKILNEPKYAQRVKELSAVYRDRPQDPLETAVYWTEYVMRHKGQNIFDLQQEI